MHYHFALTDWKWKVYKVSAQEESERKEKFDILENLLPFPNVPPIGLLLYAFLL